MWTTTLIKKNLKTTKLLKILPSGTTVLVNPRWRAHQTTCILCLQANRQQSRSDASHSRATVLRTGACSGGSPKSRWTRPPKTYTSRSRLGRNMCRKSWTSRITRFSKVSVYSVFPRSSRLHPSIIYERYSPVFLTFDPKMCCLTIHTTYKKS